MFIYMRKGLHNSKSCLSQQLVHLPVFKKQDDLRFGDVASERFNDHLGKKYQESTKTKNTH